jgi:hypothetical protein
VHRVVELIELGDLAQALVRLWVLAGMHDGASTELNRWERERNRDAHRWDVTQFRRRLQVAEQLDVADAERAPLALLTALDEFRFVMQTGKPRAVEPFEEEGRYYFLLPVELEARHRRLPLSTQTGNREAWFRWHAVIPARTMSGLEVSVQVARGRLSHELSQVGAKNEPLRVWIGHFEDQSPAEDGVRLAGTHSAAGKRRFSGVTNPERRLDSIRQAWKNARAASAHGVLLPELTVTLQHRETIRKWLQRGTGAPLVLVVAGSFHETTGDGCYNTAEMWDGIGRVVLRHRKLRPFGEADGPAEDIADGNVLEILDTPIGTMAIPICKDFLDDHPRVKTLFQEVPIDWLLVPSYGNEATSKLHLARARQLAVVGPGITTIVATQRSVEVGEGAPLPGFAFSAASNSVREVPPSGGLVVLEFRAADSPAR